MEEEVQLIPIGAYTFKLTKRSDGTYKSEPLPSPSQGIPLIPKEKKILGIFDSRSSPGIKYYVIREPSGEIYCTCMGFKSPHKCWHYNGMMKVLEVYPMERFTEPIRITKEVPK